MRRTALIVSVVAVLAGLREAAAADQQFDVVLHDAAGPERTLLLDVARRDGHWQRAWGLWADVGHNFHPGRITEGAWDERQAEFEVALTFIGDSWNRPGRARYRLKLNRQADGSWRGSHEGVFRGQKVAGRATAALRPAQANKKPGYQPARPGEHPRILFRQQDLPALRAKAGTPLGQAALAAMNDPAGMGIRYQVSGDKTLADEAMRIVEKMMFENHDGGHGRGWGECLYQIGVAYDLCHDAWPEDFRRKVGDYAVWATERLFYRPEMVTGTANWHPCSNYAGPIYRGPGFVGLALWAEKGPPPAKPPAPRAPRAVAPEKDHAPGPGVPVVEFRNDEMPEDWLFAGGFRPRRGEDPLAALGGEAGARPGLGAQLACGDRTEPLRRLSREPDQGYFRHEALQRGKDALDVTAANGRVYFSDNYFYTVISNDRPRWARWDLGAFATRACLAGQPLTDGDCVRLDKGLYPLLVVASIDIAFPHRRFLLQPRLVEQTEEEVKAQDEARQADYLEQLADWQYELDERQRTDGADQRFARLFEMSKRKLYWHCRSGVGTGGFQAEVGSYSLLGIQGPDIYAPAYRTMFCEDLSPYDDITHYVPRKMFGHVYRPWAPGDPRRGKPPRPNPLAQDINGSPALNTRMLAAMFPIVPEPWKPAALWAWNYHAGIRGPEEAAGLIDSPAMAALVFLNYPLDMQPQPPQGVMPLAWEAPTFGYYGFRNAWQGGDDFLAQAFLKATLISGWNGANAGTFRLLGLGHVWALGPTDRNRCRWEENVVQLPDDDISEMALGRLLYAKMEQDGSGVVTVDLGDVYAAPALPAADGRAPAPYEKYTSFRRAAGRRDSGIRGIRSIAVDYSGLSGTPCLMVVVDRIAGGNAKVWTWQLGDEPAKKSDPPGNLKDTTAAGNAFAIRKPDGAALQATFVAPAGAKVAAEVRRETMIGRGGSSKGKALPRPIAGVFAAGPRGDEGEFFVVVTVGRGDPPAVKIEGEGLQAKVSVGQRTIRFDGEKIVLEQ